MNNVVITGKVVSIFKYGDEYQIPIANYSGRRCTHLDVITQDRNDIQVGSELLVEGELGVRSFVKNGRKVSKTEVIANNIRSINGPYRRQNTVGNEIKRKEKINSNYS